MKRLVVVFLILLITLCALVYLFFLEKNINSKDEKKEEVIEKKVDTTPKNSTIKEKREAIKEAFGIK